MNTAFEIVSIPLSKLAVSPLNVRKTGGLTIEDLATSIEAHGLIHNLVVTKAPKGDKHQVIAGARRFAALTKLAKEKRISKSFGVPCRIIDGEGSTETSLAENVIRTAMHPADQFTAFRSLIDQGMGLEDVAARFGVTPTTVRQRLKLANVAPRLFELYREDEINLDQLMALAVTDDHGEQERVWDSSEEWQRRPQALRRALTEKMVDANDARVRFVGLAAYLNEGGLLQKDLFQADHEGYLTDTAKLDRLAAQKLEALATEVRGEGWLWVEIQSGASYTDLTKFGRIHSVSAPISDEIRLEIEALQDEQENIEGKYPEAEEYPPDVDQRMAAIEARIDELNDQSDQPRKYREEEIPLAGAIVALENHGEAVIYRGLVRPEDKKKLVQAPRSGSNGQHEPGDDDETDDKGLSAALVEDLTAHRTAALRTVVATRADVALVAVTHALSLRVCYESSYDVGSCLSLTSEKGGCRLDSHAKDIETSPAQVRLSEIQSQWLARIPAQAEQLWQWLLDQEQTVVIDLLAFCVGQTVHAVRLHHDGRQPRFVAADQLAQAVNLDMADWWTPTGKSYLGRVKKDQILETIGEGTSETNFEDLRKMKKGELVAAAERRLAGSRWLPEILKS
jgi:ParB family transcriptional regulator, chromosome partitioning protein